MIALTGKGRKDGRSNSDLENVFEVRTKNASVSESLIHLYGARAKSIKKGVPNPNFPRSQPKTFPPENKAWMHLDDMDHKQETLFRKAMDEDDVKFFSDILSVVNGVANIFSGSPCMKRRAMRTAQALQAVYRPLKRLVETRFIGYAEEAVAILLDQYPVIISFLEDYSAELKTHTTWNCKK